MDGVPEHLTYNSTDLREWSSPRSACTRAMARPPCWTAGDGENDLALFDLATLSFAPESRPPFGSAQGGFSTCAKRGFLRRFSGRPPRVGKRSGHKRASLPALCGLSRRSLGTRGEPSARQDADAEFAVGSQHLLRDRAFGDYVGEFAHRRDEEG